MKNLYNFEHRWKLRDWIDESKLDWYGLSSNPNAMYLLEENIDKIDWCELSHNTSAVHLLESEEKNSGFFKFIFRKGRYKSRINWNMLSLNPSAICLLKRNQNKIDWINLSQNTSEWAIHLLEQNPEKIDLDCLSFNSSEWAIRLLEQNIERFDEIGWNFLSGNPSAICLLEKNRDKIDWWSLSSNPSGIHLLKKYIDTKTSTAETHEKVNWGQLSQNPAIFELDYDFFYQRMNIIRKELIAKTWHHNRFQKWCLSIDELKDLNN